MRGLLFGLVFAFGACSSSSTTDDVNHGPPSAAKRRNIVDALNENTRKSTGASQFSLAGTNEDELIVLIAGCDLAVLNQLIQTGGMQASLKLGDFKSIRCEGGIKVTPPWD